jgi:hypothetical protein
MGDTSKGDQDVTDQSRSATENFKDETHLSPKSTDLRWSLVLRM